MIEWYAWSLDIISACYTSIHWCLSEAGGMKCYTSIHWCLSEAGDWGES